MATLIQALFLAAAKNLACKYPLVGSYRVRTVESVFFGCGWCKPPQAPLLLLLPPPPSPSPPSSPSPVAGGGADWSSLDDLLPPLDWDEEFEELSQAAPLPAVEVDDGAASTTSSSATTTPEPEPEAAAPSPSPRPTRWVHHHNFLGEPVYYDTWNPDEVNWWAIQLADEQRRDGVAPLTHDPDLSLRRWVLKDLARRTVGWVSVEQFQEYLQQQQQTAMENAPLTG